MEDMYICLCGDVRESQIKQKIQEGLNNFEALQEHLGVACGCMSCYPDVLKILEETQ